jgi:hypothetical protein
MDNMIEILAVTYLILGLFLAMSLWTILIISKRPGEIQTRKSEAVKQESPLASKAEPVHLHVS